MTIPAYVYTLLSSETLNRWQAQAALGSPVTITYSFPTAQPAIPGNPPVSSYGVFNATEQAAVLQALAQVSAFTQITFQQVAANDSTADIRFANADLSGIGAPPGVTFYSYNSSGFVVADVILDLTIAGGPFTPGSISASDLGGTGWSTLLHEIGHALGLKHPFETNVANDPASLLAASLDNSSHSLMSYTSYSPANVAVVSGTAFSYSYTYGALQPSTFQVYDIAALQYLYGVNSSSAGGATFTFSPDAPVYRTIYDNGPGNRIDVSALSGSNFVDLTPGAASSLSITQSLPYGITLPSQYDGTSAFSIAYGVNIAAVSGGSGRDVVIGNSIANSIESNGGNDAIYGLEGGDTILAGSGIDWAYGGEGHDSVDGGDETDALFGEAGNDTILGGNGDDGISGGDGNDSASGGSGTDWIYGGADQDTIHGGSGINALFGEGGNDSITAGDDGNSISGGDGSDTLAGGTGIDWLYAGIGNNSLDGGGGNDALFGDTGNDTLAGNNGDDGLSGAGGNDSLAGGAGVDWVFGGTGDDIIDGGAGVNALFGENGHDTMAAGDDGNNLDGGVGNDALGGGAGVDWFYGGDGNDTANGGGSGDQLYGEGDNDSLSGGAGGDGLDGGYGDDTMDGGTGSDQLTGYFGADVFVTHIASADADLIMDFETGVDRIGIVGSEFGLTPGTLTFSFETGSGLPALLAAGSAAFYYDQTGRGLWWDPTGGATGDIVRVAGINAGFVAGTGDFMVV